MWALGVETWMRGNETRVGQVPLGDESERAKGLVDKVTCGCVLESTPTWFLVGTIECSCGTGRTNFPRPGGAKYLVPGWSLTNASLAQPNGQENTWTLRFPAGGDESRW